MEVELNLLPGYRKLEIQKSQRFWLILRLELAVVGIILLFCTLLWSYIFILGMSFDTYSKELETGGHKAQYEKIKDFDVESKEVNIRSNDILTIQNNQLNWYVLFTELERIKMDGITITGLATVNYTVSFSGKAAERDDLMAFKYSLEQNSCFSDVDLPLSNLVKKEDVDFQLDIKIKEECLKK